MIPASQSDDGKSHQTGSTSTTQLEDMPHLDTESLEVSLLNSFFGKVVYAVY